MRNDFPEPTPYQWLALALAYLIVGLVLMSLFKLGHSQLRDQPSEASEVEEPPSR